MTLAFAHRVIFIRHGQTAFNAGGRLQGQSEVPLNARGRDQASAIGRFLRGAYGDDMARLDAAGAFWASPLQRARETMELARAAMGLAPQAYRCDARLEELSFGAWEGLNWSEVAKSDPAGMQGRLRDKWGFAPSGGESYAALTERVKQWLGERDGDCFIAAHGGVGRALMVLLAGLAPDVADSADVWQGRAMIVENGGFTWVG